MNTRFIQKSFAAAAIVALAAVVPACGSDDNGSDAEETTTNAVGGAVDAIVDLAFVSALRNQYPDVAADMTDEEILSAAEDVCDDVRDGDDREDLIDSVRDSFESGDAEIDDARADQILNLLQSTGC
ncbi:DUF732 domain-containing protein [Hoyosella subflava]|uniref:DUF732 domain-containing protein n=1 Tax=Hoyosella subflava (strain DSM 45089 / JCM 17490 / NBRC 109087 / DQS3-9A1) TaxID=443218 RepID=F6ELZ3_HOYSD|nr:DUF732 domain-containing protein [Hoyosella subflava]AEF42774.1 hypothetical protein AS9A_4341 [Hoyosella subflava DQS3-9A1]